MSTELWWKRPSYIPRHLVDELLYEAPPLEPEWKVVPAFKMDDATDQDLIRLVQDAAQLLDVPAGHAYAKQVIDILVVQLGYRAETKAAEHRINRRGRADA